MQADGVGFEAGLTDEEVQQVEQTFGLRFPPDLRAFLQAALPTGDEFVPWCWGTRDAVARQLIQQRLQVPVNGLVYDARNSSFWLPQWGEWPADAQQREQAARQQLASWPPLIPIYAHRYLPAWPHEAGNPVFSVWGSDIVYYGYDLLIYFLNEFKLHHHPNSQLPDRPKLIAFWSDFDEPRTGMEWGYWDEQAATGEAG